MTVQYLKKNFSDILRVVGRLCGLAQTSNFELTIHTNNSYVLIQHRLKGVSTLVFREKTFEEELRFGKAKKPELFNMIFYILAKLPRNPKTVGFFRLDKKILLESHPLEQSFQSILRVSDPFVDKKNSYDDLCKNLVLMGVEDNPIVQHFDPRVN